MFKPLQVLLLRGFFRIEGLMDRAVGVEANPLYHLGALCWFFFWIVSFSGVYLFIPYETSAVGAWTSLEYISRTQWYLGGVMRGLHRYASDAMVFVTVLHLLREFAFDRYHGVRWFAWFTGVPLIWMLLTSGITGYWLVWDSLAQYLAVGSSEWLDWLEIFGEAVARNFLTRGSLNDRFFTLLIFIHVAVPLFLLFTMWVHIMRVNRPDINPPKVLAIGSLITMVVLSLVYPALSHEQADLAVAADKLHLDWWYLALYPMYDQWGAGTTWAVFGGVTIFLMIFPWLSFQKRARPAHVILDKCNGCTRCYADCPFGAVTMVPRTDGRPHKVQAKVDESMCTGCGICVGACPTATPFRSDEMLETGIDLLDIPLVAFREKAVKAMEGKSGHQRLVIFGCEHGVRLKELESQTVGTVEMPCAGMLAPSFIDFMLSGGYADGVVVCGCRHGDCHHRLGPTWLEQRLNRTRQPYLRDRVPRERVLVAWNPSTNTNDFKKELADFQEKLAALGEEP